ncbi:2-oxoglutarate dehydrogenase, E2 component, dihydrolipoamide succinyltransferase [Janibacter melonis]|uniref:2-oxoglutarate dehydrogenase, E2 component, dihydrolipoamide succinyltransferase n=1 Tax=Janibacter melonis TaxID=262209 RepID=UPI001E321056|nr:2-oxoglutarate dehydrogenase, E2 component, dihydrolipoamide succinyltransferase [Janibacter melonis]MCB5990430.1 2-oxoglutarate dehydrogenase, E2 component, dihydrolipoamide succinyltransferase [Janibacter melonis]
MSERVTMPALGESVTEGTVTRWLKSVGDSVEVDEPLLEVSTDKVDTEIPSPVAGTLQEILVEEDETVEVGADLAVIGDGDAPASSGSDEGGADDSADEQAESPAASEDAADTQEQQAEAEEEATAPSTAEDEPAKKPQAETASTDEGQKVQMPALGESVTEGTVTRWLKAEGDEVEVDEPLLEVSTDKVDTEIPSPVAGTLTSILVQEDETVEVGADLAVIGGSGGGSASAEEPQQEAPKEEAPKQEAPKEQPAQETQESASSEDTDDSAQKDESLPEDGEGGDVADQPAGQSAPSTGGESAATQQAPASGSSTSAPASGDSAPQDASKYVTPLVRKLAADNGIDLADVQGSGVGGRIRKEDVLEAARAKNAPAEQPSAPAAQAPAAQAPASSSTPPRGMESSVSPSKRGTREKMTRLRKVIAQRMVESLQVSAQLTTVVEVDMTKIARVRARTKADFERREGTKLSFLPFIALATAEALKQHPVVNSSVEGEEIVYHGSENLSIAVDTERGLLTPVVKNAGDLNVAGLARAIADVAERTRANKITPDDLSGGTFTITNTGSRGALFDTPILNQPQVAMLGTGAIVKRPIVVTDADGGETIAVRSMMYLALSYDHRVVDGADAARFLGTVKARLEEGSFEA